MNRPRLERWVTALLLCGGLALLVPTLQMPMGSAGNPGPGLLPLIILLGLIGCCAVLLIRRQRHEPAQTDEAPEAPALGDRKIWGTLIGLGVTALIFEPVGYKLSIFLLLLGLLRLYSRLSWSRVVVAAALGVAAVTLFFGSLLGVQLPVGLL
jgi:putative tricarboxylic transport membrane protein